MPNYQERVRLLSDALERAGVDRKDIGQAISRLNSVNEKMLESESIVVDERSADFLVSDFIRTNSELRLLWPETSDQDQDEPEPPQPRRIEPKGDIILTSEQVRDHRVYRQAMKEAKADGVKVLVEDEPVHRVAAGLSKDASGLNQLGVKASGIKTIKDYERAKAQATEANARLKLLDE